MAAHLRVLFLTLRSDFGGGPEHLWKLLTCAPDDVVLHVACPQDYPYYARYQACLDTHNIVVLPHRKFDLFKVWELRNFCRQHGIQVLHSHGKGAGLYARLVSLLTGLPCVHTFHGVHLHEYRPWSRGLYCVTEKCLAFFTRVGITVSAGEREQIVEHGLMPQSKVRLIENGVSIPDTPRVEASGPPYRVVSMSRFDAQKNSQFMVEIALALQQRNRLGDFHFFIVGDGPGKQEVEHLAHDRGVSGSLTCTGATPTPHLMYEGALAYVATSRWEGMPLAVLEAMAHGLVPVVTDVVGNRDVVQHAKTGFLYQEGDAGAPAEALCRLADDAEQRHILGAQARSVVQEQHDVRTMASATYALLREVACKD